MCFVYGGPFKLKGTKTRPTHTPKVPKSCIESAEYIIQCVASKRALDWFPGQARTPPVIATFGDRVSINITEAQNFQNDGDGLTDYDFSGGLPSLGESWPRKSEQCDK